MVLRYLTLYDTSIHKEDAAYNTIAIAYLKQALAKQTTDEAYVHSRLDSNVNAEDIKKASCN